MLVQDLEGKYLFVLLSENASLCEGKHLFVLLSENRSNFEFILIIF